MNLKIKSRDEISNISERLKREGKVIGFTSGSFDILHIGHADYLKKAKEKCDLLIVGINSNISVKKYKGENRPIVSEKHRAGLVSALECVDYVFLFDERRNKENIESIKPDFYIKAGDYCENELTSAVYLKPWNGQTVLIPVEENISSTKIIDKIKSLESFENLKEPCKAVFLDRDGVINKEIHFLHEPEKFELLPGVIEGLKKMQEKGYRLIVVSNQGGIGLGYFSKEDFFRVNSKMLKEFSEAGIGIDKIYFCPHSQSENCDCRKPKIGLFERSKKELNIDMKNSFMIGDRMSDIVAGKNAGVKTILIEGGVHKRENSEVVPDFVSNDLVEAGDFICGEKLKALVTGGAGFIGSNLALELERRGYEVVIVDNLFSGSMDNLKDFNGKMINWDISVKKDFWERFDVIFHQAAITDPRYPNDEETYFKNVKGFENMIELALKDNAKFIYASSASVYGNGVVPMNEDQVKAPFSAYARSKLKMDEIAEKYFDKMHIVGLRYFNVFGPREAHKGRPASMIYHLRNQMLEGETPKLFKFGEQIRDHIYVKDVVKSNIVAMDSCSGVYNVGTGVGTSFNEIVKVLNEVLGMSKNIKYIENPYGENYQANTHADIVKAESVLGFKCDYNFFEGVKEYDEWLRI
jgi:ADP-L-glycero-D-manno-heptose 6-epimerase